MDKRLTRALVAIAGIILISVSMSRGCANSETVADYAASHSAENGTGDKVNVSADAELVTPDVQPIESAEIAKVSDGESNADSNAAHDEGSKDAVEQNETSKNSSELGNDADLTSNDSVDVSEVEAFYIEEISDELKERMNGKSYADNIDESIINYSMLRHIVIKYYDFNDDVQLGEIVCNEKIAQDLLEIFEEFYNSGYQLERVHLIDEYDADDDASMDDNNTSCFNYRVVDNTTKLSYHAYGLAIDVNPFYNPYVQMRNGEKYVCPTGSVPYANRDDNFPYKIDENDLAYKLFKQHGFIWGGDWNSLKDYQHFEKRVK